MNKMSQKDNKTKVKKQVRKSTKICNISTNTAASAVAEQPDCSSIDVKSML